MNCNQCPSCHRRDGLNPRAEVLQCVYCGWEPITDIVHDAPDKAREEAEDMAFYASLMGNDTPVFIEESVHSGGFPEIDGLVSLSLAPAVSVQFDEQNGTLLLCVGMEQAIVESEKVQELLNMLYGERDAIHVACQKEVYC